MRRLHVLKSILVRTHADKILLTYLVFVVIAALIIQIVEPGINRFVDALWYCYAVISTAGFGDIVVTTFSAKVVSVLLTAYSIVVIALVTGVIVNYYNQLIQIRQKDTLASFSDRLQRLPELSKEELEEMSANAKEFFKTGMENNMTIVCMSRTYRKESFCRYFFRQSYCNPTKHMVYLGGKDGRESNESINKRSLCHPCHAGSGSE